MRNASKANPGAPIEPPEKIEPKSAHTADSFLQAFLSPTFDAAEYLNSTLPPLQGSSAAYRPSGKSTVPLAELSTEAQTLLTSLNAHTTRLSGTLTQLTEDVLRSGSRLAYEVELLRGETLGLAETLMGEGPLRADLERFVPAATIGSGSTSVRRASLVSTGVPPTPAAVGDDSPAAALTPGTANEGITGSAEEQEDEPPFIAQLRTLTLVRSRLDAVIKTFGDAMEFVFPPSEISVSSGFLSVSAPDIPNSAAKEQISTEEKGQQVLKKLREEISSLLKKGGSSSGGGNYDEKIKGVEEATKRVEEIKVLSVVWKGTAEEKGRQRFVESLARMVEDRHRELVREMEQQRDQQQQQTTRNSRLEEGASRRDGGSSEAATVESRGPLGGYGFMNQWQKIRGGL